MGLLIKGRVGFGPAAVSLLFCDCNVTVSVTVGVGERGRAVCACCSLYTIYNNPLVQL
jgi:hypothetical protein